GSGQTAITINADPNDAVNLTGLLIEGAGVGKYGIVFNSGKSLTIENCMVRNLTDYGINFVPTGSSRLAVSRPLVANIGIRGIAVGSAGSGTVTAALNRVKAYGIGSVAIYLTGSGVAGGSISATVTDSIAAGNAAGFAMTATGVP